MKNSYAGLDFKVIGVDECVDVPPSLIDRIAKLYKLSWSADAFGKQDWFGLGSGKLATINADTVKVAKLRSEDLFGAATPRSHALQKLIRYAIGFGMSRESLVQALSDNTPEEIQAQIDLMMGKPYTQSSPPALPAPGAIPAPWAGLPSFYPAPPPPFNIPVFGKDVEFKIDAPKAPAEPKPPCRYCKGTKRVTGLSESWSCEEC